MTSHPSFDDLNDLADGEPVPAEITRHVAGCTDCRTTVDNVRALIARAAALAREVEPLPPAAWPVVRRALGRADAASRRPRRPTTVGWALRAAAVVVALAGSWALASLVPPWADSQREPLRSAVTAPRPSAPAVAAVSRSYADVVVELTRTVRERRDNLAPRTLETVERSLRVIDEAITEAEAALAADPANGAVLDILTATYEQKVELLRRASELPART